VFLVFKDLFILLYELRTSYDSRLSHEMSIEMCV